MSARELELLAERLEASLDRVRGHIRRVSVQISDINGPRGGEDKRCAVRVELDRGGAIQVSRTGASVWTAASLAFATAQRRCHEQLDRARARRPA